MSRYFERLAARAAAGPPARPAAPQPLPVEHDTEVIAAAPQPLPVEHDAEVIAAAPQPLPVEHDTEVIAAAPAAQPEPAAGVRAILAAAELRGVPNAPTQEHAARPRRSITPQVVAAAPATGQGRREHAVIEAPSPLPTPQMSMPVTAPSARQPASGPVGTAPRQAASLPAPPTAPTPIVERVVEPPVAAPRHTEPLPSVAGPPERPTKPRRVPIRPSTPRVDVHIGTLSVSVHTPPAPAAPPPPASAPTRNDYRPAFSASRHYLRAG